MGSSELWKYCDQKQCKEFILSLKLLGGVSWSSEKQLACLYAVSNHTKKHYHIAEIPKKDGSSRQLLIPDYLLKMIQKNILKHVLSGLPVSSCATAYRKGCCVKDHARFHVGKKQILKLDIEDFFGNITFPMVYQYGFPGIYFPPAARSLLTYLCCYKDYLPQGAPTSSALSNLVMKRFDDEIGRWCEERQITYTRYCDDMTFSGDFEAGPVIRKVSSYLDFMGFTLNRKKTKVLSSHNKQSVTGITVNSKLQASKEYRRKLRQEIYYGLKYGETDQMGTKPEYGVLLGKINFVLQINPQDTYFLEAKKKIKMKINNG